MSPITTHVLDTARGCPAERVPITLERRGTADQFEPLAQGTTDSDGRLRTLLPDGALVTGIYRLRFDTGGYFGRLGSETFYPCVEVQFEIRNPAQHYHVPLLISPFGYSTYRGS